MARDSPPSSNSGKKKQDMPLEQTRRRVNKDRLDTQNCSPESSHMPSNSAIKSSADSKWASAPHGHQLRTSQGSPETSWASHDGPHGITNDQGQQLDAIRYGNADTRLRSGLDLLHVGAQFRETYGGETRESVGSAERTAYGQYVHSHSRMANLAPMDRYRLETLGDGPYTHLSQGGVVYGFGIALNRMVQSSA